MGMPISVSFTAYEYMFGVSAASLSDGRGGVPEKREILYLLAVGQFRAAEYSRSRRLVDQALQISPDFRQASALKQMIEDKIAKDGIIGVGLAAGVVALVASGIVAAVAGSRSHRK
jgi:fission 1 protein